MKKPWLSIALLLGLIVSGVQAQDFKKIAGLVTDVEALLQGMKKESTTRVVSSAILDSARSIATSPARGQQVLAQTAPVAPANVTHVADARSGENPAVSTPPAETREALHQKLNTVLTELKTAIETPKPPPYVVSGFVDCYLSQNFDSPESRGNRLRAFDVRSGQFDVSMAKVSLQKAPEPLGFRLELAFGSAPDIVHTIDGMVDQTYKYIHQAYATALVPVGNGLTVDVGQFTSPLGAEVIESNANWHHSRSILFWYAVPTFHVGVRLAYPVTGQLSVSAILVNGCGRITDNNEGKTFGAQVAWTPVEGLTWTQNVLTGPEQANNVGDSRTVWDGVIAWQAGKSLAFNVNYDYGHEAVSGNDAIWTGVALMSRYSLDDRFALSVRGEWFSDRSGWTTGTVQDLREVTMTCECRAFPQLLLRAELRRDWSSADAFESSSAGTAQRMQQTFSVSSVFEF